MFERFIQLGLNHRFLALLLIVLVSVVTVPGVQQLQVGTDFSRMIADTDRDKQVYQRVAAEFGSDNRSLVYVRDQALWSTAKLARLEQLHQALDKLTYVERVDSLFTLRSIRSRDGKLDSHPILTEAYSDPQRIAQARDDALYHPLIPGNFLSDDALSTALMVQVKPAPLDTRYAQKVYAALEQTLDDFREDFDAVFEVGPSRINAELNAALSEDLRLLGPVSAAVLVMAILLFLRSGMAAVVPLLTSGLSIAWTFGLMGWLGIPLTLLSAMLPSLIIAIGSTEETHMMSAYLKGVTLGGDDLRRRATRFMLKSVGAAMLLTTLTTALGFAGNSFSDVSLIREFAIVSTFAIFANGVITWLLLPILLSVLGPRKARIRKRGETVTGFPGVLVKVFGFTRRRFPRLILLITALLCGFFVLQAANLYVTNDPMTYFKAQRPLLAESAAVQRNLAGLKVFFIALESSENKAFLEPENLRKLREIQQFVQQQGIFDRSVSLVDHLSLVNREFHDGEQRYYDIPGDKDLTAQLLLLFHRNDLASYVSQDYQRANIVVRHSVSDSNTLNRHILELKEVVRGIAGDDFNAYVVGENLMINAAAETLLLGQVQSLAILLLVIFLIMSAMFTSYKGGMIALIPSVIPIILMFGIMGWLDIPLNPGTAMVAVIAVGIAIDGTIHMLSRYNELCRHTSDYDQAVTDTVNDEAIPVVATSMSLALGFGVLLLSQFSLVAQFGALAAATMLFSIFANLLITPIIMTRIRLVGLYQILSLSMHHKVLRDSPLFAGMTQYQVRKAILISELNRFSQGERLIEQDTVGRSMYLILEGEAKVSIDTPDGSQLVALLEPGDVIGEIGFIRETHRTANVTANTPIEALRFDYESVGRNLRYFPHIVAKLNFNISGILGDRLAKVMEERSGHQA